MHLLLFIFVLTISSLEAQGTDLADAVAGILLKNYQDPFAPALLSQAFVSGNNSRIKQDDLLNSIICALDGKIAIRFNVPSRNPLRRPWTHHVWLVDSYEAFGSFYHALDVDSYDYSGRYLLVHSGNPKRAELLQIFKDLLKQQIVNVVFVGVFDGEVELWTYVPFAPGSCFAVNLIMLPDEHWIDDFYPDKTSTLHGCGLKVGAFETRPYTFLEYLPSQEMVLGGFEGDLLKALRQKLNFKVTVLVPPGNAQWGYAFKKNSTGLIKMIQEEEVDFGIACLGVSTARNEILKPGDVHYTTALVISVVALITIAVVHRMSHQVKYFVFGRGVGSAVVNLYLSFFGMALHVVPSGTFARTLLCLWILHTFIMRTLYQGSSFKYLQLSLTRPPSRTLNDVDATDALYHVIDVGARYYEAFPERTKRLRFLPPVKDNLAARLMWMTQHQDSPDVMMSGLDHVAYHNRQYRRRPAVSSALPRKIRRFLAAGLMDYWVQRYGDYDFTEQIDGSAGPKPLSLGHLVGTFELCGVMMIDDLEEAVESVLSEYFVSNHSAVIILRSARTGFDLEQLHSDILDRVMAQTSTSIAFMFPTTSGLSQRPCFYNLLLIDGYLAFQTVIKQIDPDRNEFGGRFLFVMTSADRVEKVTLHSMFSTLWSNNIVNVIVITKQYGEILMYSYFPYSADHCEYTEHLS
ncbi:hypothetical protein quinque_014399 [Culex quinquefasciatus]